MLIANIPEFQKWIRDNLKYHKFPSTLSAYISYDKFLENKYYIALDNVKITIRTSSVDGFYANEIVMMSNTKFIFDGKILIINDTTAIQLCK